MDPTMLPNLLIPTSTHATVVDDERQCDDCGAVAVVHITVVDEDRTRERTETWACHLGHPHETTTDYDHIED